MNSRENEFFDKYGFRVLKSLRRIIRAVDIHSRKLLSEFKITSPQMICLYMLRTRDEMTQSELAKEVDLGPSTITGIVDRLEAKGYVVRTRSAADRRRIMLQLTDSGRELVESAPSLLQDQLTASLMSLPELEQATIALSLERIVELMNAEHLDASRNLLPSDQIQYPAQTTLTNHNLKENA